MDVELNNIHRASLNMESMLNAEKILIQSAVENFMGISDTDMENISHALNQFLAGGYDHLEEKRNALLATIDKAKHDDTSPSLDKVYESIKSRAPYYPLNEEAEAKLDRDSKKIASDPYAYVRAETNEFITDCGTYKQNQAKFDDLVKQKAPKEDIDENRKITNIAKTLNAIFDSFSPDDELKLSISLMEVLTNCSYGDNDEVKHELLQEIHELKNIPEGRLKGKLWDINRRLSSIGEIGKTPDIDTIEGMLSGAFNKNDINVSADIKSKLASYIENEYLTMVMESVFLYDEATKEKEENKNWVKEENANELDTSINIDESHTSLEAKNVVDIVDKLEVEDRIIACMEALYAINIARNANPTSSRNVKEIIDDFLNTTSFTEKQGLLKDLYNKLINENLTNKQINKVEITNLLNKCYGMHRVKEECFDVIPTIADSVCTDYKGTIEDLLVCCEHALEELETQKDEMKKEFEVGEAIDEKIAEDFSEGYAIPIKLGNSKVNTDPAYERISMEPEVYEESLEIDNMTEPEKVEEAIIEEEELTPSNENDNYEYDVTKIVDLYVTQKVMLESDIREAGIGADIQQMYINNIKKHLSEELSLTEENLDEYIANHYLHEQLITNDLETSKHR